MLEQLKEERSVEAITVSPESPYLIISSAALLLVNHEHDKAVCKFGLFKFFSDDFGVHELGDKGPLFLLLLELIDVVGVGLNLFVQFV